MKYLLTAVISALITGSTVYLYFNNQTVNESAKETAKMDTVESADRLREHIDYYKNIDVFTYLLDDESYQKVNEFGEKVDNDEELGKEINLVLINALFKFKPELEEKYRNLFLEIEEKKNSNSFFEKNTACEGLIPQIKDSLATKNNNLYGLTVTEDFETIFYSPTQDSCLYVTNYSTTDFSDGYNSDVEKRIYKTNSDSYIKSSRVYSSEDTDNTASEQKSLVGKKEFVKYIMENSNYNSDVFDSISYIK